jgi:hypothetical protein
MHQVDLDNMIHRNRVHGGWAMMAACDVNEHQFRGVTMCYVHTVKKVKYGELFQYFDILLTTYYFYTKG